MFQVQVDYRTENVVFAFKVMINIAAAQPACVDDIRKRSAFIAVLIKQLRSHLDEIALGFFTFAQYTCHGSRGHLDSFSS